MVMCSSVIVFLWYFLSTLRTCVKVLSLRPSKNTYAFVRVVKLVVIILPEILTNFAAFSADLASIDYFLDRLIGDTRPRPCRTELAMSFFGHWLSWFGLVLTDSVSGMYSSTMVLSTVRRVRVAFRTLCRIGLTFACIAPSVLCFFIRLRLASSLPAFFLFWCYLLIYTIFLVPLWSWRNWRLSARTLLCCAHLQWAIGHHVGALAFAEC